MSDYKNNCTFDYAAVYYKVVGQNQSNLEYKEGIIQDTVPFNPTGSCAAGGIYFVEKLHIKRYYGQYGLRVAELRIPYGTPVYLDPEGDKWKAPQIEIIRFLTWEEIADLGCLTANQKTMLVMDEKTKVNCLSLLYNDYDLFQFMPNDYKTIMICTMAVSNWGGHLQYVPEALRSAELCALAVSKSGSNLQYVPEALRSVELCTLAVSKLGAALQYVPEALRSVELCTLAVNKLGAALQYVPETLRSVELCTLAVSRSGAALQYVPDDFQDIVCSQTKSCIIM